MRRAEDQRRRSVRLSVLDVELEWHSSCTHAGTFLAAPTRQTGPFGKATTRSSRTQYGSSGQRQACRTVEPHEQHTHSVRTPACDIPGLTATSYGQLPRRRLRLAARL